MKNSWVWRVVGALILLAVIAAVGIFAYNAGLAQGQASALAPHAGAFGWGARTLGLGVLPGLILFPILFFAGLFFLWIFVFLPLRLIFGPYRMRMHGRWHAEEGGVPPFFEEWHRKAHENKPEG
jgi:hypothetical protein